MTKRLFLFFIFVQTTLFAQTAPNLIVNDLDGESHNLYNYLDEGKTVILDFFFVNCASCQDGAPYLDEFWNTYGPNGSEQIQVISLEVSNATDQIVENTGNEWGIENPIVNLNEIPTNFTPFIESYPTYMVICPDRSMTPLIDFNYPQTILAWEQNLNICDFGSNITDATIFANDIIHCQQNFEANIVIGNVGTNLINSLTIDVYVDSIFNNSIIWNHTLPPNTNTNNTPFPIDFNSNNIDGEIIEFIVSTSEDINPINNRVNHDLNDALSTPDTEFSLEIQMDNYPLDLIWILTNSTNDIVLEGFGTDYAPYEFIEITTNLDSNDCYNFTLLDLNDDGICCSFGEGYFNILSNQDTLIYNTDFDSYFSQSFYVGHELGIEGNINSTKRITNRLYYNLMGQIINKPTKRGVYLQQVLFEDGTYSTEKILLTNTIH